MTSFVEILLCHWVYFVKSVPLVSLIIYVCSMFWIRIILEDCLPLIDVCRMFWINNILEDRFQEQNIG